MPANVDVILQSLDDAVTLSPVYEKITDWAIKAVDDSEETISSK